MTERLARPRSNRPRRSVKLTPVGRAYLILTLGAGLGALNTGNNLLYLVVGVLLANILVSSVLSERALAGLEVRRLGTEGAFAGEPFSFRWEVRKKSGAAYALTVGERTSGLEGEGRLAHLRAGATAVVRANLVAERRGPHRLETIRVTTAYPFGLFAKSRLFPSEGMLLVYPKRVAPERTPPPLRKGSGGTWADPRRGGGQGDLRALRALREGEDARGIHWSKSAEVGELLAIEREREQARTHELSLEPRQPGPALERACEALAAKATWLLEEGCAVGLTVPEAQVPPGLGAAQRLRILEVLANVGFEPRRPA